MNEISKSRAFLSSKRYELGFPGTKIWDEPVIDGGASRLGRLRSLSHRHRFPPQPLPVSPRPRRCQRSSSNKGEKLVLVSTAPETSRREKGGAGKGRATYARGGSRGRWPARRVSGERWRRRRTRPGDGVVPQLVEKTHLNLGWKIERAPRRETKKEDNDVIYGSLTVSGGFATGREGVWGPSRAFQNRLAT
ncbi:hypothetical protein BHE74_00037552 [Ensete ventricosum]|nr:hypothetical protein BHE74_00037552 [Ensete ventricosum]